MRLIFLLAAVFVVRCANALPCTVQSGPRTAALVELYTAHACSACLEAERWLSTLDRPGVLPFALHVDAGAYTGTRRGISPRQRKLTILQRMALVYTPQVMLQGRQFSAWNNGAFDAAVATITAQPAKAHIRLQILGFGSDEMVVRADATAQEEAVLYLAAYEARTQRRVVLEWRGPYALTEGRLTVERQLPLLPKAAPGDSGLAGLVQSRRSAETLQVVMLPACEETFGYIRAK